MKLYKGVIMKEENFKSRNEHNDDIVNEINTSDIMIDDQFGDKPDSFDRYYSLLYSLYHMRLCLVKIELYLKKYPTTC